MTFDDLHNALENNQIESDIDKKIVQLILEAERDWIVEMSNLDEFISLLEIEIGDETSKTNLSKLQNQYRINGFKNSAWNAESVYSLQGIFELTEKNVLKEIFTYISNRLNKK